MLKKDDLLTKKKDTNTRAHTHTTRTIMYRQYYTAYACNNIHIYILCYICANMKTSYMIRNDICQQMIIQILAAPALQGRFPLLQSDLSERSESSDEENTS